MFALLALRKSWEDCSSVCMYPVMEGAWIHGGEYFFVVYLVVFSNEK